MTDESPLLRPHAEQLYADELAALERADDRPRPPRWRLSPWAVTTYVLGGEADGVEITPKYVGRRRLVELAVATLATDRALLLLGVPGTAKTWLSEHLAAAVSGDSTLIVQGTAGTPEEALRYGWNYARLLAEGPSRDALVAGPVFRAMQDGKLARIEELTRIPSDIQDALITILSEKMLPIPELDDEVQAVQGFNVIATANDRDRGVNELSSAMRRRFNTVVLPLPDTAEEEVEIVRLRLDAIAGVLELPPATSALDEIRRVVTIFRELRSGVTEDGRTKLKSPSGTLSTAEAISVVTNGLALATHFGDGRLSPEDVAGGLTGAVVQDPVQDKLVWQEYLEAVVREREGWGALYRACRARVSHRVFGIRHHGPGSARSLERALAQLEPDAILIEGPPEADALLPLAAREEMAPPVALLTYVPDEPARAAFYPFARFSPEWRAIRFAQEHDIPVRFMDLPAAHSLAERDREAPRRGFRADPLAALAEVAGHGDPERWWEDVVESQREGLGAFEAVTEAMAALREAYPAHDDREEQREAHMRQAIRAALKHGAENVAVVCGAWHAPALTEPGPAAPDARTLKGLPKVKVAATWVPWTYGLLARDSGYGAGVSSPAWYDQLFDAADDPVARWLSRAARLLREQGLDASVAQVVDAARLAAALAGVRERPLAGLDELLDAARATLCHGSDVPLALIEAELVVGHRLGEVPDDTPMVPLQQDVARLQRRLRLKPEAQVKDITLDLRRSNDRERSRLLHRLNLLEVHWGERTASRGQGTFKEGFRLEWYPGLALDLIHAGRWGTTVDAAAGARARARAAEEESVAALAQLADAVLLADLPDALESVLQALADRAALDRDTADLMTAVPPLAGILRYGDVRGSDTSAVARVLRGIVLRVAVGLPGAGVGADEATGATLAELVDGVNSALALLEDEALTRAWREALRRVADGDRLPGMLAGRATRLLHDAGELEPTAAMSRALSPGEEPERGASWIEGFIGTSGLVLVHDPELLSILDGWVASVTDDAFTNVLPLLRRAFSVLPTGERRRLGERLKKPKGDSPLNVPFMVAERAGPALETVARLLGSQT